MAVEFSHHYSVEVKSRFDLFLADESDQHDDSHHHNIDATKHETQPKSPQPKPQVQPDAQRKPQRNTAPQNSARQGGQTKTAPSNRTTTGTAGEPTLDHPKEEHRPIRRARGHTAPLRGREFDRKSGSDKTGVKAVPKKDGYGVGNWGTIEDELDATMNEPAPDVLDVSNEQAEEEQAEPQGPTTYTLEEWKAMQKDKKKDSGAEPTRTANDGQDVFKNMKLLKPTKAQDEVSAPKFASVYQKENDTGIVFSVGGQNQRERTGGRGGFRGGRGGRGAARPRPEGEKDQQPRDENKPAPRGPPRGAPRGARGANAPRGATRGGPVGSGGRGGSRAPQLANENDFPSLS